MKAEQSKIQLPLIFLEIGSLDIDRVNPAFFPFFKTLPECILQDVGLTSGHGFLSSCYGAKIVSFKAVDQSNPPFPR